MSQVCHKSTKYTFNFLCHLWEGVLKHISSEMSPLWFHKRHWCFIDISPRLLISAAKGVFSSLWDHLTATHKEGATKQSRKVPAAVSRRTWLPEEPPAHTDTAPEPKHKTRRSDIHVQRHTLSPGVLCALPPLWSSWWSAVGEWGSSLDPSSPSPPGSSGSWTDPPNTSALEEWQAEINKDPQFSKQKESDTRKRVCEWQGCELTKRRNVNFKSDISYNITLW